MSMIHNFEGTYIPRDKRKKILLISDDIRMTSGVSTVSREIVIGTAHHFNWINVGGAVNHPEQGKRFDLNDSTNEITGINDASVYLYPTSGYGSPELLRALIKTEKPDALMFITDPRYFTWLFQIENELRRTLPMIYLNIWDDYPAPLYNEAYYESCDTLMAISKQTANINRLVLGDKAKDKIIKYIPHGINEEHFFKITPENEKWKDLQEFKKQIFQGKDYEFVILFNSRNIRRKNPGDVIASYRVFLDSLTEEQQSKVCLLMHTQVVDENGTDLNAVKDLLLDPEKHNIVFSDGRVGVDSMNYLYNVSDVTMLISSNEGWGLSLTESMMAEKMIIGNVTGGMQDQMRFEDENGKWIDFDENFCSNHMGTYKKHGEWVVPVFPTNLSLVGSVPTPYIWDDRCDFRDVAKAIREVYDTPKAERERRGKLGRDWVTSDESMQSARLMCKNAIDIIDETFDKWKPRHKFELIKIDSPLKKKHIKHKLIY